MKIPILTLLILICVAGNSQDSLRQVISSAGETFTNETISVSWTLGEAVTETFTSSELIINQGFQQGNLVVSPVGRNIDKLPGIRVYPNPVDDILIIENSSGYEITFSLSDITGKILLNGKFSSDRKEIVLNHFISGIYFLHINNNKTHKIIIK